MRLTNRKKAPSLSATDIFHVVLTGDTSQSPEGSSYYSDLTQLVAVVTGFTHADVKFTEDIPVVLKVNETLGHYHNGQTIPASGKTLQEVIIDLATGYIDPTFSVFTRSNFTQGIILEVGNVIANGVQTFTWDTTSQNNMAPNVVSISLNTPITKQLASGLVKSGSSDINTPDIITMLTPAENKVVYTVAASSTISLAFNKTLNATWRYRWFYGKSALADLTTENDVITLPGSALDSQAVNKYVAIGASTGSYIHWVIPKNLSQPSGIRDSNSGCFGNNIPFESKGDIVINRFGQNITYTKYRSTNTIDGSINTWLCS